MKRFLLLALSVVLFSTLGGCAFMSDEDKDFYGRGWVKPTDLDNPYPNHTGTPKGDGSGLSTTSDPTQAADSAWDVPGGRPR